MKILVVGAGGVGAAFAPIAASRDFYEHIVFADLDPARGARVVAPECDQPSKSTRTEGARPDSIGEVRPGARDAGLHGSMGRVGACADNAAMESFFSLLQKNVLDTKRWTTREELRLAIVIWIERTYHRRRRQRGLGKLTPIEFETIHEVVHAA